MSDPAPMYCLAEYNAHDLFMGWHLYERRHNDGRPNPGREWGWLRDDWQRAALHRLCVELGEAPPADDRYSQDFAEWFARYHPDGLLVERTGADYRLVAACTFRPRQRAGVVRTIRGAAMADRARRRRKEAA